MQSVGDPMEFCQWQVLSFKAVGRGCLPVGPVGNLSCATVSLVLQITASRLLQSKQTIPHYYLSSEIRVDKLLE